MLHGVLAVVGFRIFVFRCSVFVAIGLVGLWVARVCFLGIQEIARRLFEAMCFSELTSAPWESFMALRHHG